MILVMISSLFLPKTSALMTSEVHSYIANNGFDSFCVGYIIDKTYMSFNKILCVFLVLYCWSVLSQQSASSSQVVAIGNNTMRHHFVGVDEIKDGSHLSLQVNN